MIVNTAVAVGWKHDSRNRRSNCSASSLVSVFGFGVFPSRSSMITMIISFSARCISQSHLYDYYDHRFYCMVYFVVAVV